jgi:hypothetical protein
MNWPLAISRNRDALLAIVATIVALLGHREGSPISRRIRSAALALLRPAESAARRLIVMAARGLSVSLGPPRPPITGAAAGRSGRDRCPAFPLFDRSKRFGRGYVIVAPGGVPRIRSLWGQQPAAPPTPAPVSSTNARPVPDTPAEVGRLDQRLRALEAALADLPRQARRLARWRARRAAGAKPCAPLRPGTPPGFRQRPVRDVDIVLRDCHALACDALGSDTS